MFETPEFPRGSQLTAAKLQETSDLLELILRSRGSNASIGSCGFLTATPLPETFWARVTGNNGGSPPAHSWIQVQENGATQYIDMGDGMQGDKVGQPLYDINGQLIPTNKYVRIWRGMGDYYLTLDGSIFSNNSAYISLTSETPQSVTLASGGSATVYPAKVWTLVSGVWTAGAACWYLPVNEETPGLDLRFLCNQIAQDNSAVSVYSKELFVAAVKVTSLTTSSVNLSSGGSITAYPAEVQVLVSGTWTNTVTSWFYPLNSETPTLNYRYHCLLVAKDTGNTPVWATELPPTSISNTTINYTNDTFEYFGIENFYIENNSFNIYSFPPGGNGIGGIIFDIPFMECGYLFECCTTITLSAASYNNLTLPAVGSPDQGAIVYDVTTSNTGGTTLTGIQPTGFQLCNNGDVSGGTATSPIVLTVPAWYTQPAVGQIVVVKGINGLTGANGTWAVTASTATTVTLGGTAGGGAFTASPGSSIQLVGPQKIRLVNVGVNPIILSDNNAGSNSWSRFFLPPTYATGGSVTLEQDDTITLWWDYCTDHCWKVIACTVDIDTTGSGPTSTNNEITLSTNFVATSNTWTTVSSFTLTLPSSGTYLIHYQATLQTQDATNTGAFMFAALNDAGTTTPLANTSMQSQAITVAGKDARHTVTGVKRYVASGSTNITMLVRLQQTAASASGAVLSDNLPNNAGTHMGYTKIA